MSQDLKKFDGLRADITRFVAPVLEMRVTDLRSSQEAVEVAKQIKQFKKELDDKRRTLVDPLNQQVRLINDYAKQVAEPLDRVDAHVRAQINAFAAEQARIEQAALARLEAERREAERKAAEERARVEAELEAKRQAELAALEADSDIHDQAAALFGTEDVAENIEEERLRIEEDAARIRAEEQARLDREAAIRKQEFNGRSFDIGQRRIKGTRTEWKFKVEDPSQVPREFLMVNEAALRAHVKATKGANPIPGVKVWEEKNVAIGGTTRVPALAYGDDDER